MKYEKATGAYGNLPEFLYNFYTTGIGNDNN